MTKLCPLCKLRPANNSRRCQQCVSIIVLPSMVGKNNPMWKGDKVSYRGLHRWVYRHKRRNRWCSRCHKHPPLDLANISQKYKRDVRDWEWLCRRCHMLKDGRMNNLKQFQIKLESP